MAAVEKILTNPPPLSMVGKVNELSDAVNNSVNDTGVEFSNGCIVKTGIISVNTPNYTYVTFDTPFPNKCISINVQPWTDEVRGFGIMGARVVDATKFGVATRVTSDTNGGGLSLPAGGYVGATYTAIGY